MAGKIVADTLEHSTAGSIATNYVVKGSAKAWQSIDADVATPVFNDSFNASSLTDDAEGKQTVNFSNSFSTADYVAVGAAQGGVTMTSFMHPWRIGVKTTSSENYATTNTGQTAFLDSELIHITQTGDLA